VTVKKTIEELAEVLFRNGATLTTIKNTLAELGFPSDKIEHITTVINSKEAGKSQLTNDQPVIPSNDDTIPLQEELKRQRVMIESCQEELGKLSLKLTQISQEVKSMHGSGFIVQDVEARLNSIEAKIAGVVEAVSEYLPTAVERAKTIK